MRVLVIGRGVAREAATAGEDAAIWQHQRDGVTPELSHGTHFFQDLVEANILPLAIYPDAEGGYLNRDLLNNCQNELEKLLPEDKELSDIIRVINLGVQGKKMKVYLNGPENEGLACMSG